MGRTVRPRPGGHVATGGQHRLHDAVCGQPALGRAGIHERQRLLLGGFHLPLEAARRLSGPVPSSVLHLAGGVRAQPLYAGNKKSVLAGNYHFLGQLGTAPAIRDPALYTVSSGSTSGTTNVF
jgi:hypothetical protein